MQRQVRRRSRLLKASCREIKCQSQSRFPHRLSSGAVRKTGYRRLPRRGCESQGGLPGNHFGRSPNEGLKKHSPSTAGGRGLERRRKSFRRQLLRASEGAASSSLCRNSLCFSDLCGTEESSVPQKSLRRIRFQFYKSPARLPRSTRLEGGRAPTIFPNLFLKVRTPRFFVGPYQRLLLKEKGDPRVVVLSPKFERPPQCLRRHSSSPLLLNSKTAASEETAPRSFPRSALRWESRVVSSLNAIDGPPRFFYSHSDETERVRMCL